MDFLGDHIGSDYPITDLAEKSGLSRPTIYIALADLVQQNLVVETRKLGNSRMFRLNAENPLVRAVLVNDFERSRAAAEAEARASSGVSQAKAAHARHA